MQKILILFLLAASFARAGEPLPAVVKITPGKPVTVEAGRKCVLVADTTAKKVTWKVPSGVDAESLDGKRMAVWGNPGGYQFIAMIPAGDDVLDTEIILTVTGPRPPPDPDPKPDPVPTSSLVYIAVIRDPGQVTPTMANLIGDTKFWDSLKTAGHEWDFYAHTSPEAIERGYIDVAKKVQTGNGYTATMIVMDKKTGKVLTTVQLPANKAAVIEVLKGVVK